jgi:laminin alpha 3/5
LKNGSIQCFCFDQFHATGPRCEQCLPGYIGYPKCQRRDKCSPTCSANAISCDVEKNKCICPANWAGPTCSKCATGYSGSDCKATAPGTFRRPLAATATVTASVS